MSIRFRLHSSSHIRHPCGHRRCRFCCFHRCRYLARLGCDRSFNSTFVVLAFVAILDFISYNGILAPALKRTPTAISHDFARPSSIRDSFTRIDQPNPLWTLSPRLTLRSFIVKMTTDARFPLAPTRRTARTKTTLANLHPGFGRHHRQVTSRYPLMRFFQQEKHFKTSLPVGQLALRR